MQIFRLTTTLLLSSAALFATESKPILLPADECGDPARGSEIFFAEPASVVEVIDGETLVVVFHDWDIDRETSKFVTTPRYEKVTVKLDCIEAPPMSDPIGRLAALSLQQRLLGKDVSVSSRSDQIEESLPFVEISLVGGHPISEGVVQLEQGLATIRSSGPCRVGSWSKCHYELAENRARENHLGVWKEP